MQYILSQALGAKVKDLRPNYVMVAYLGVDWRKFLDNIKDLKGLIVQPNPPTNPRAIKDIADIIGWEKIQFLDNLHAKVYINIDSDKKTGKAITGSPNLTDNGLGGSGLYEAAVQFDFNVTEDENQDDPFSSFNRVWKKASEKYQDESAKKKKLEELEEASKAYWKGLNFIEKNRKKSSIYQYGKEWKNDFWPISYKIEGVEFHENGDAHNLEVSEKIEDYISIANDDEIIKNNLFGKWILQFKLKVNGELHTRCKSKWLYIHHAYKNQCKNEELYHGVLIEEKYAIKPNPPFELDANTQKAITKVLGKEKYYDSFIKGPDDGTEWKTQQIDSSLMSEWLADVIEELKSMN